MKKKLIALTLISFFVLTGVVWAGTYSTYPSRGSVKGANVLYNNTDTVTINTGYGECNGKYWEITNDITYQLTGISGEDFYYIYIDDSMASYPDLDNDSFAHSNTEPAWSDTKFGWYNGNDRMIGVVWVKDDSTISEFLTNPISDNKIEITTKEAVKILINTNGGVGTITGSWQNLDVSGTTNSSLYVPVNATDVKIYGYTYDGNSMARLRVSPQVSSGNYNGISILSYSFGCTVQWVALESSRCIMWWSESNDEQAQVINFGWRMVR